MFWDTHMHCHFSGDSEASSWDMAKSAIDHQLDGICFTDHLDFDYPDDPKLFTLDIDSYQEEILSLKSQLGKLLTVHWGIEIGLQPQIVEKNRSITQKYPFDFVIGSSHVVHGMDPYYDKFYEGRSEDAAYAEYFSSILENIKSDADYDVYGHLDYVVRYGPNKNKYYSYEKYSEIIDEILRQLIEKGKGIELNTAGFKHGLGHPNPTEKILKRFKELGGEIITIGSDAHKPEYVAYDFNKVRDLLLDAGFSFFTVFRNRRPIFYPF